MDLRNALDRRRLMLAAGLVAAAPRLAWATPGKLVFAVFRNGSRIGEHQVAISGEEGSRTASTEVAMTVRVGPVPVYRYRHRAVETWRDGRFVSIETFTEANGKKQHVTALADSQAVTIEGPAGLIRAPADAAPLSHWNTAAFTRPMFNQQEGRLLKVRATRVAANHWSVRGEAEIDDFYDPAGQWQALRGKLNDGSTMEYRRT